MTVDQTNGSVRVRTRMLGLGAWLGSVVLVGAITGCGLEEGPEATPDDLLGDPSAYLASASGQNTIHFRNATGQLYQLRWNYTNKNYTKTTLSPF